MYIGRLVHSSGFDSLLISLHITHVRPSNSLANQQLKHLQIDKKKIVDIKFLIDGRQKTQERTKHL